MCIFKMATRNENCYASIVMFRDSQVSTQSSHRRMWKVEGAHGMFYQNSFALRSYVNGQKVSISLKLSHNDRRYLTDGEKKSDYDKYF